jgi:hypothetical protein
MALSSRASDFERDAACRRLREGFAEGRLTDRELEERVERAYLARTRLELVWLTRDLPRPSRRAAVARRADQLQRAALRAHVYTYGTFNGALVGLWGLTGEGDFWPAWTLVPGGLVLAWHAAGSRRLSRRLGVGRSGRGALRA